MAKVFAVVHNDDELELLSWSSASRFLREGNAFTDERFIYICTTEEYKQGGLFSKHYDPDDWLYVVHTESEKKAITMIHEALKRHFGGKTFDMISSPNSERY